MATINLGRIKPVFQGAYNASTAYVVDDIVTFGGESFICILASTGNATSNATYWSKIAKKGDDVSQLTTHGDFLFRDASGDQRLAKGTDGQFLKIGANDPVWADVPAGSPTGGNSGANKIFWENEQTVTHDYTITNNYNAGTWGPVTINSGVTVTIGDGEYWTIM